MKIWKRVYCGLLAAWLLYCAGRALLLCTGGYYKVQQVGKLEHFCDGIVPTDTVVQPPAASRFAELNAQLEAAQPGTRFFYAPYTGCSIIYPGSPRCITYAGLLCSPVPGAPPELSPEAEAAFTAWCEANGYFF